MIEHAARPERRGLLIFADADALADKIAGRFDAGIDVIGLFGMKKTPARKNRQRDHVGAARARDQKRRHRHFRDFEFLKLELAPESFGWMGIGRDDLDAVGLDRAVHQRLDALVIIRHEAQG